MHLQERPQLDYAAVMKTERIAKQASRTIPDQQARMIDKSRDCGLIHEVSTHPQTIPLPTRNVRNSSKGALERLVRIAKGDSGQCRIVGNFLLAWWNAAEYGGFDLTDLWAVDAAIAEDMIAVLANLVHCRCYPDSLGYGPQFRIIAERRR